MKLPLTQEVEGFVFEFKSIEDVHRTRQEFLQRFVVEDDGLKNPRVVRAYAWLRDLPRRLEVS